VALRFLIVALLVLLPTGCSRESQPAPLEPVAEQATAPEPQPEAQSPAKPAVGDLPAEHLGPADVVRRVNEHRRAGRLGEMADYVAEDQRAAVIDLVGAVDQLLLDNLVLQDRIKASGGKAIATLFDRRDAANIIDVFSHDVEVAGEQVDGDSAEVTIRVGQRLPFSVVRLQRQDGGWIIQPDPPVPGLADEIRHLGKALRRVAQTVEQRELSVEEIKKEIEFWQTPVLKRIEKLLDEARSDHP
jgi:hypothetical protein